MAIQTGAEGAFWPLLAGGFGAILFGLMAYARLPAMMEQFAQFRPEPQPEPQPTPRPPPKMEEPEPKVIYYQPMPPPRPKLRDGRGDDDRIIDL